jgi:hypothetical protein
MSIAGPILLAAATLIGSGDPGTTSTAALSASISRITLSDAVSEAARRESLRLDQPRALRSAYPGGQYSRRRPGRHSVMTRTTAIVAGAIMGSLAGMLGGAAIDMATSNGECLTGMSFGLPVGAVVGGVLTAYWVR